MCGISGLITSRQDPLAAKAAVSRISNAQFARGPDNQGLETIRTTHGFLTLAHNRLKIIDLSDAANQPFMDLSRQYCLTFNGEVYNYLELKKELPFHFETKSDTEVVLNAYKQWGIDCLKKLNGPFAFALYDSTLQILYLCRDRFGKKPLFYYWHQGDLYFASSAKAIAKELGLKPNLTYVARGLHYWVYDDTPEITPYEGLFALPPGSYLKFDLNSLDYQLKPYYDLQLAVNNKIDQLSHYSHRELIDEFSITLSSAIHIRLRADVPVAVSLSGGLDSTAITATAAKMQPNLQSFTFGHPALPHTEAPLITQFISRYQIIPNYIAPGIKLFEQGLYATLRAQEAPFPSLSVVAQYLVYQAAREKNIKVLLGGQGGDEVLMGYRKYYLFYIRQLLRQRDYGELFKAMLGFQQMLLGELPSLTRFWKQRPRYDKYRQQVSLLKLPQVNMDLTESNHANACDQRQLADIIKFSLPTLLRYEDRNSMGNSIESRLPFLDYRVVEFGLALPIALKLNKGYGKWVLRELMQDKLPDTIRLARYKRGFDVMQSEYIHQGLGDSIRKTLSMHQDKIKTYLPDYKNINQIFNNQQLISTPKRLGEVLSLLWLINPYGELE